MKTLVLYATKYGAAGEIAGRIAKKINGAVLYDLKQGKIPLAADFDCVIIGSSIYAGMIRKEAKEFISRNSAALMGKKLGLFICGLEGEKEQEYFKANFSDDILKSAKTAKFLGGIFDPAKAGMLEKVAMKVIAKQSGRIDKIDDVKINEFVREITS